MKTTAVRSGTELQGEIPFVNLDRQLDELRPEILSAIERVLVKKAFIQGPFAEAFEREFAAYVGARYAMGCANGTAAISLALQAAGIGQGDEVITVSHTFAATAAAICHVGAKPVFVDIEPHAYTMDPAAVEAAITSRTRALVPVHLYGTPCDMEAIREVVGSRSISLVEDAAQAHGAQLGGRPIGSSATIATYSFYPGKNLGALGDAGALVTNDEHLAERVRKLRDHGRKSKYLHDEIGYNHRMDGIQAAILSVKLRQLDRWNQRRRDVASAYDGALRPRGFKTIVEPTDRRSSYHLYIVEVSNRDEVQNALSNGGIGHGVHYPVPLHQQPAYRRFAPAQRLPVTERAAQRILSLPICGHISDEEVDRVLSLFLDVARP